jgi:hypothetical protein
MELTMATKLHETPTPKVPDPALRQKPAVTKEEKIDRQMEDSFPASDPPSYSGGNHAIGAPVNRESESPKADTPAVIDAEKQVKDGKVTPHKY